VSFAAALFVANKAREVKSKRLGILRRALWAKLRRHPFSFLFPTESSPS